jgi:hypothetical protein
MSASASPDIRVLFGQGSPFTDITDWITSDIAIGGDGIFIDGTPYGATNVVNRAVGMTDHPDVTLEGFFEDDDNGPFDVFGVLSGPNTADYTLKVIWTQTSPESYSLFPCAIKTPFKPMGKVKDVTRFQVVLTQRGPVQHYRQGVLVA